MALPSLRRIAATALFGAIAFAGGACFSRVAVATDDPYSLLGQLARVLVIVENEYVEPVERKRLLEGSIKGLVAELDPHSSYLPADEYRMFEDDTRGRFGGVGVEVDFRGDSVVVIAPIEGSPADEAGILPGDRIVAIDGVPVRGKPMRDLVGRMRGAPGTKVVVSVQRPGREALLYFTLARRVIEVSSVVGRLLAGNVGYVRIKQFQAGTHDELLRVVGELRDAARGALSGTVIDLRNNPGGLVDEATAVADELLREGTIYGVRRRGVTVAEVRARPGGALAHGPVVVLVNAYSASAAELLAGAVQDHRRATLVGAPTFGKGSVQSILELPDGAGLRLTTLRYYTPAGHAIQARGIQPDVLVEAAYVKDRSFGVLRESDLEHHLPAEGREPPARAAPGARPEPPPAPDGDDTHLGVAREVPHDPTRGRDLALSVGYQIVRGVLRR